MSENPTVQGRAIDADKEKAEEKSINTIYYLP